MNAVTYTEFRKHLAGFLNQVTENHTPLMVTRQNGDKFVVMSLDDFHSYEETFYLRASKNNAERLNAAIEELRAGLGKEKELIEE